MKIVQHISCANAVQCMQPRRHGTESTVSQPLHPPVSAASMLLTTSPSLQCISDSSLLCTYFQCKQSKKGDACNKQNARVHEVASALLHALLTCLLHTSTTSQVDCTPCNVHWLTLYHACLVQLSAKRLLEEQVSLKHCRPGCASSASKVETSLVWDVLSLASDSCAATYWSQLC